MASLLVLLLWLATPAVQSSATSWPLREMVFNGLNQLPPDYAVRLSGLTRGQTVSTADLGAVANRLAQTGLFREVRYRYTTDADGLAVTFEVSEEPWTALATFENFVWFNDEDLLAAIGARVPVFRGRVEAEGRANQFVSAALEDILASRNVKARVEASLRTDLKGARTFQFFVRDAGVNLRPCALRFPGATAIPEADVAAAASELMSNDYARSFAMAVAAGTLTTRYRNRGHWSVAFAAPMATLGGGCDGVTVTIAVTEGPAYRFAGVRWAGHAARTSAALDETLGLRPGDVADQSRLEAGLIAVQRSYSTLGYLTERHTFIPELNDATREATFAVSVSEGPQFRMGGLSIAGLGQDDGAELSKRWPLKPNQVFDMARVQRHLSEEQKRLGLVRRLQYALKLDLAAAIAHVTLTVSDASR